MFKLARIIAATTTIVALSLTGVAAATPASSTQCKGQPSTSVAAGGYKALKVSGTIVNVGSGAYVTVTGNNDCVITGYGAYVKVTGNGNYATASGSSVYLIGSNNFFQTQGRNFVNCGGSHALLDDSDYGQNCIQD